MKRKIYCLALLLALIFTAGCNKEKKNVDPTPTVTTAATATPTPVPENLAKTNLLKLPEQFDKLMSYVPQNAVDYSNGIGYDIDLEFSLGEEIAELLGLTGLDTVNATGMLDMKDRIAGNITLGLNDSEVMQFHLFADSTNLLFNLPKYSADYAAATWEQLTNSLNENGLEESPEDGSSLTGSSQKLIPVINTINTPSLPSNEELLKIFRKHLQAFAECFTEVAGRTENVSIGTGDYTLTGDKYTVRADLDKLTAVLESLESELQAYEEIDFGLEDITTEGATALLLDYYSSADGAYAWAAYMDDSAQASLVFVNTSFGFCLYHVASEETLEVLLYSEKTSDNAGVITIPSSDTASEDMAESTITYEFNDTFFSMHAMIDELVLTLEASKTGNTIFYDITLVAEGVSIVLKETLAPEHVTLSCTLASYGLEYATLSLTMDTRDYVEIPVPQNTVDMAAWADGLDQNALLSDLMQLVMEYPFLLDLLGGFDDPDEDTAEEDSTGSSQKNDSAETAVDFSGLTGYSVDSAGNVDFLPLESEVLALGKPSTGMDTLSITEDQKQALLDYAKNAFTKCDTSTDTFYWIWGTVEFNDVKSYYTKDYYFTDTTNPDNFITLEFDAVSGEFAFADICHENKETALRMANEILALLDIDYTITAETAENYTFARNFSFSAYDASTYGDNYYNVSFSVYYPEW